MKKQYLIFLMILAMLLTQISVAAQDDLPTAKGLIPSVISLKYDYTQPKTRALYSASNLPSRYDLREQNRVTEAKNQNPDGTCWVFASTASAESSLLRSNMTDTNIVTPRPTLNPLTYNFSENHMKQSLSTNAGEWGYSLAINSGGNRDMATAYLARAQGEVLERNDPYVYGNNMRLDSINKSILADKYLEKAIYIPEPSTGSYYLRDTNFRDKIKQAVVDYGGVFSGIYYNNSYYNYTTYAYNYNGTATESNHAVCIVGWDDNYSSSNFSQNHQSINGAFIAKNSWGANWGENGYFYISYEDKLFGQQATSYVMSPVKHSYKNIYQYDPLGWISNFGYGNNTVWFANVFTSKSTSEYLTTVGFYATDVNTSYEIYFTNLNAKDSIPNIFGASIASGTISNPGYYAIDIPSPPIIDNAKFVIAVKVATPNATHPVPIEYSQSGYSDNSTASVGQSYTRYSQDYSWDDLTDYNSTANVCLKAFTTDGAEYRTVFKQNSLVTGQIDFRVYCDNKIANNQSSKVIVSFLSDGKLLGSKIFDHTFSKNTNSYYDFSFENIFNAETDLSNITTKVFVTSPFVSAFAPLMRYAEEMNKN